MSNLSESKRRVLVVDDEPSICHLLREILLRAGHEVKTAWSSKEALEILNGEFHDLVITDFSMPGMKGDVLSAIIKEQWPGTLVLMLTACAVNLRASATPLPFVDVLLDKPFDMAEFLTAVEQLLSRAERVDVAANQSVPAKAAPAVEMV